VAEWWKNLTAGCFESSPLQFISATDNSHMLSSAYSRGGSQVGKDCGLGLGGRS